MEVVTRRRRVHEQRFYCSAKFDLFYFTGCFLASNENIINPRADSVTCCAGAAYFQRSIVPPVICCLNGFKYWSRLLLALCFITAMLRQLKTGLLKPLRRLNSFAAPGCFILCRTFGSQCWGGGSGGEETHGVMGCVRSVRSQNHSAAPAKKKQKNATLTPSANQRAALQTPFKLETQVVTTHQ